MRTIRQYIPGRAFFPGGAGLFRATKTDPLPPMPHRPIMLVGHNFDSERGYADSFAQGEESITVATWNALLSLLDDADVEPDRCFFTNAIMGLKPGDQGTGESPGFRDRAFRSRCAEYLRFQIEIIKPSAVVTMGLEAFEVFQEAIPQPDSTLRTPDWKSIDKNNRQFAARITLGTHSFSFAALVHPSFRNSNVHRRSFDGRTGNAAEIELLRRMIQE